VSRLEPRLRVRERLPARTIRGHRPAAHLYVPAPVTRTGQNEVTVIELEQLLEAGAHFVPAPLLGPEEE